MLQVQGKADKSAEILFQDDKIVFERAVEHDARFRYFTGFPVDELDFAVAHERVRLVDAGGSSICVVSLFEIQAYLYVFRIRFAGIDIEPYLFRARPVGNAGQNIFIQPIARIAVIGVCLPRRIRKNGSEIVFREAPRSIGDINVEILVYAVIVCPQ